MHTCTYSVKLDSIGLKFCLFPMYDFRLSIIEFVLLENEKDWFDVPELRLSVWRNNFDKWEPEILGSWSEIILVFFGEKFRITLVADW